MLLQCWMTALIPVIGSVPLEPSPTGAMEPSLDPDIQLITTQTLKYQWWNCLSRSSCTFNISYIISCYQDKNLALQFGIILFCSYLAFNCFKCNYFGT